MEGACAPAPPRPRASACSRAPAAHPEHRSACSEGLSLQSTRLKLGHFCPSRESLEAGPWRAYPQQGWTLAHSGCFVHVCRAVWAPKGLGSHPGSTVPGAWLRGRGTVYGLVLSQVLS